MLTIGQAAERSGVPAKTIRYYEEVGLVRPAAREENRYRQYGEEDIATLRFIGRARALGFSLKAVERLLDLYRNPARSSREVRELALAHVAEIDCKRAELKAMRDQLADLAARCDGDRPDCPILDELVGSAANRAS